MYTDYLIGGIYHYGKSSLQRFQQLTSVCFAEPASARRIHPPAFGRPPFGSKGKRLNGQARRLLYAKLGSPMQDFHLQGGALYRGRVTWL